VISGLKGATRPVLGSLIFVGPEFGNIVPGVFTPGVGKTLEVVLAHRLYLGGRRPDANCNFEPMQKQVEQWQKSELTDVTAKVGSTKPSSRANSKLRNSWPVRRSRTVWSLSNAFTSAFKELQPIPQFKATVPGRAILTIVLVSNSTF